MTNIIITYNYIIIIIYVLILNIDFYLNNNIKEGNYSGDINSLPDL
jgi:hypothetical protein